MKRQTGIISKAQEIFRWPFGTMNQVCDGTHYIYLCCSSPVVPPVHLDNQTGIVAIERGKIVPLIYNWPETRNIIHLTTQYYAQLVKAYDAVPQ